MRRHLGIIVAFLLWLPPARVVACSYREGHFPGWVESSGAERLVRAEGVAVATVLLRGLETTMRVEEVLSGPVELAGSTIGRRFSNCSEDGRFVAGEKNIVLLRKAGRFDFEAMGPWVPSQAHGPFARPIAAGDPTPVAVAKLVLASSSASSMADRLTEVARLAPPSASRFARDVQDDHDRAISPSRPFVELRRLYEQTDDARMRGRILDAMAQGGHREGLPLARAVIAEGTAFETIPAAIRFAIEMKDAGALPGIIELYPVLARDFRSPFREDTFMRDVESGRRYGSFLVIRAINSLAGAEHAELVKKVLRVATAQEARELGSFYFRQHPAPEAIENLRVRIGEAYVEHWQDTLVLASLGDEAVVTWALSRLEDPVPDEAEARTARESSRFRWLPYHVLGRSPLSRAKEAAEQLVAGGGTRARWIRESRR